MSYTLNFSNQSFLPSKKCFYIKRISNIDDETFLYNLEFYLSKYHFDGVVYVGEQIGDVLPEYFSQDIWEQSVMMQVNVIGFYLVGEGISIQNKQFKENYLFIQNCKEYKIESKKVTFNPTAYPVESQRALEVLEHLVEKLVDDANEIAGH